MRANLLLLGVPAQREHDNCTCLVQRRSFDANACARTWTFPYVVKACAHESYRDFHDRNLPERCYDIDSFCGNTQIKKPSLNSSAKGHRLARKLPNKGASEIIQVMENTQPQTGSCHSPAQGT